MLFWQIANVGYLLPRVDIRRIIRWPLTFEDFKVIIWLGQSLTLGWVLTMVLVTVNFGTCCHGYPGNAIDLSLSMCRSCPNDP